MWADQPFFLRIPFGTSTAISIALTETSANTVTFQIVLGPVGISISSYWHSLITEVISSPAHQAHDVTAYRVASQFCHSFTLHQSFLDEAPHQVEIRIY